MVVEANDCVSSVSCVLMVVCEYGRSEVLAWESRRHECEAVLHVCWRMRQEVIVRCVELHGSRLLIEQVRP